MLFIRIIKFPYGPSLIILKSGMVFEFHSYSDHYKAFYLIVNMKFLLDFLFFVLFYICGALHQTQGSVHVRQLCH
jgi:hypothetical protein